MTEHKDWNAEGARFLTLREKATAGPWAIKIGEQHASDDEMLAVVTDCGNTIADNQDFYAHGVEPNDLRFIAAAHEMADCIAGLMAENERAKADYLRMEKIAFRCDDDRQAERGRADAAETKLRAQCEMEPTISDVQIDQALAETLDSIGKRHGIHGLEVRTDIAEHATLRREFARKVIALIRRPSMEKKS